MFIYQYGMFPIKYWICNETMLQLITLTEAPLFFLTQDPDAGDVKEETGTGEKWFIKRWKHLFTVLSLECKHFS